MRIRHYHASLSPQHDAPALSLSTLGLGATVRMWRKQEQLPEGRKPADLRPGQKEPCSAAPEKAWGQLSVLCYTEWTIVERREPMPSKELYPIKSGLAAF